MGMGKTRCVRPFSDERYLGGWGGLACPPGDACWSRELRSSTKGTHGPSVTIKLGLILRFLAFLLFKFLTKGNEAVSVDAGPSIAGVSGLKIAGPGPPKDA